MGITMSYSDIMLAFGWPGPTEMILIAAVGLLIFGNRLPDVGRSLGKGIVEFKKGVRGIKDEIDEAETKEDETTKSD